MWVGEGGSVSSGDVMELGRRCTGYDPSLSLSNEATTCSRWIDGHDNAVDAKLLAGILAVGVASSHGRDRHRRHASDGGVGSRGDGKVDFVRPEATQALDVAGVGGAALSCPAP